jgi:hypothetical protein
LERGGSEHVIRAGGGGPSVSPGPRGADTGDEIGSGTSTEECSDCSGSNIPEDEDPAPDYEEVVVDPRLAHLHTPDDLGITPCLMKFIEMPEECGPDLVALIKVLRSSSSSGAAVRQQQRKAAATSAAAAAATTAQYQQQEQQQRQQQQQGWQWQHCW